MSNEALKRAISALDTQVALACALGIRSPSISGWLRCGRVPADRCWSIEVATRGSVTCEQLRPDVTWSRNEAGDVVAYHVPVTGFDQQQVA
jgi:DNA-binding transcriptional regulator YdaS (Cro superfamily)